MQLFTAQSRMAWSISTNLVLRVILLSNMEITSKHDPLFCQESILSKRTSDNLYWQIIVDNGQ